MRQVPGVPRCDAGSAVGTMPGVRFSGEITTDGDGLVQGRITVAGGPDSRFSGWLELLRLLESRTDQDETPQEGTTG